MSYVGSGKFTQTIIKEIKESVENMLLTGKLITGTLHGIMTGAERLRRKMNMKTVNNDFKLVASSGIATAKDMRKLKRLVNEGRLHENRIKRLKKKEG